MRYCVLLLFFLNYVNLYSQLNEAEGNFRFSNLSVDKEYIDSVILLLDEMTDSIKERYQLDLNVEYLIVYFCPKNEKENTRWICLAKKISKRFRKLVNVNSTISISNESNYNKQDSIHFISVFPIWDR